MPELQGSIAMFYDRWRGGDRSAGDHLYSAAYRRLRTIASALLGKEAYCQTLQPTALVSEFFLKIHGSAPAILDDDHFFHFSARAMRQVLTDRSRARKARKRIAPEAVGQMLQAQLRSEPETGLTVKAVFANLKRLDAAAAEIVWLRCVEGLTISEVSERQNLERWRVRENYEFGLRWMAQRLTKSTR